MATHWTMLTVLILHAIILVEAAVATCDTVQTGYQCQPNISHYWGQYSAYFTVEGNISSEVPCGCDITFVNILSRHGARNPTASKTPSYISTIQQLQSNVTSFAGKYAFLAGYNYSLVADALTTFGQQEMVNSGIKFYDRYESITESLSPFVRSSSEARVVESAQNWTQGYHSARLADKNSAGPDAYPYNIVVISEANGSNNTLNHGLCTQFENGTDSNIASKAQSTFASIFVPNITARLNADLPGAKLTTSLTINLMDLCPFDTIASPVGTISPFCALFTDDEWHSYDYYQTLGKYYGYSLGNPLGPTQGVGFTNELLARMTNMPVNDYTSTNHTLDSNPATFPTSLSLYADFSHDNDITGILSALGLYNHTQRLSNTTIIPASTDDGYSAAWTVPFGARVYFEKMTCNGFHEELVRVIVNDRVVPLVGCGVDELGRCTLSSFVAAQSFAREGGLWNECFT